MTPIQNLIALNPTSAVIVTMAPADYDPASEEDFQPGGLSYWPLIGSYSGVKVEGDDFKAKLVIDVDDMPPHFSIQSSRVGLEEGEYGVKYARPRRRFGIVTGYTLELKP